MIPIQNVYYMLSYAFHILQEQGYKSISTEEFHNVAELCAAILAKGIAMQLKRGISREYKERTDALSTLRGRIDISESIRTRSLFRQQIVCMHDEFTIDSSLNRILKTTLELLICADISRPRRKELRKLLVFFADVETIDPHTIDWHIRYHRNNQTYRMLISICYLVIKGMLETNTEGVTKLMDFLDEQRMCRLYEKFILEYYRHEIPMLNACASQIPWALDDDVCDMLPVMRSDITLSKGGKLLIIDAKYYTHTTQKQFDVDTLHSANLYQIFAYVKNKEASLANEPHEVSGMLLYAKTDEPLQIGKLTYGMSGNRISVRTLDLNQGFPEIAAQLNGIAKEYFDC